MKRRLHRRHQGLGEVTRGLRARSWLLCLLLTFPAVVWAQTAGDTTFTVHGRVLNGSNDTPIARALVTSGDRRLATMTDTEGRFTLTLNVPGAPTSGAGTESSSGGPSRLFGRSNVALVLSAQKPGYLPQGTPVMLVLDAAQQTASQDLRLMPAATLEGRVLAEGTGGAANVRVMLLAHQGRNGRLFWQPNRTAAADSEGEFRFSDLRPGEYTVSTAVWQDEPSFSRGPALVTQQYPPLFAGDVAELAAATKFHLHYGEGARTELQLRKATFYSVSIPVDVGDGKSAINARLAGSDLFMAYSMAYRPGNKAVEGALPNGNYTVVLSSFGQEPGTGEVALHVAGAPVRTAPATLSPAGSLPVHVQAQLSQASQAQRPSGADKVMLSLSLQSLDQGAANLFGNNRSGADADFAIPNVVPGTYEVTAMPSMGYVAAMSCDGVDLLAHPLAIGVGGTRGAIQVTIRDDFGSVSGRVSGADAALRGVVILVPLDGGAQLRISVLAADGTFAINDVPPGSYRLLAGTGEITQITYKDESTLRALERKGQVLRVQAGDKQTADVVWVGDLRELVP